MIKKKILVLGINGLLGNRVFLNLSKNNKINVFGTLRNTKEKFFNKNKNKIFKFNLNKLENIKKIIKKIEPEYVINCIGITNKKINETKNSDIVKINSLFPHYLDELSIRHNFKFVHISTDCIFAGNKNFYTEEDKCDVSDIYGTSKFTGEIRNSKSVTFRTSIIGHELNEKNGLLEWFLSKNKVFGFHKVIYSGVTTNELSRIIEKCIFKYDLKGLYQISSNPISKFELLNLINKIYNRKIIIKKNLSVKKKLILKSTKFKKKTKIKVNSWMQQIINMKKENDEK